VEAVSAGRSLGSRGVGPRGIDSPAWRVAVPACVALLVALFPQAAGAESKVTLRPASGSPGIRSSVVGVDFGRRDPVTVTAGGTVVGRTRTSRRGSFRVPFAIPEHAGARIRIVSRSKGRRLVNVFYVSPVSNVGEIVSRRGRRLRWTPGAGVAGSAVNLDGAGFPASRRLRVRLGPLQLATPRTDLDGGFSALLRVPPLSAGRRFLRVRARRLALGFFFEVTSFGTPSIGAPNGSPGAASGPTSPTAPGGTPGTSGSTSDPVIAAAGDIACDPGFSDYRNGLGTASRCRQKFTSDLLVNSRLSAVLTLGDNQYECATFSAYTRSYGAAWGRVKAITRPVPGNHEYGTPPGCTPGNASGYFTYFGAAAGDPARGYYSYDVGAWHLVALNSNCSIVSCSSSSAQVQWLRQDLAAHPALCTLGYWHHPRFTSGGNSPGSNSVTPLYQALYDHGADVVLVGHDHHYERFGPQDPNGGRNPTRGIREFVVGTGGRNFHPLNSPRPNSEVRNNATFGVLNLALHPTRYDWQFVPEAGKSFRDSGTQACH
jgi:calcineurin-like phosphoesterase family protein